MNTEVNFLEDKKELENTIQKLIREFNNKYQFVISYSLEVELMSTQETGSHLNKCNLNITI